MIVVGWDSREGGEDALELGRLLGRSLGADLLRVSVIVTGLSPRARRKLDSDGGRTVVAPSVARGLSDVATEVDAPLVVVGSSHRGRVGQALFGTAAEALAEMAPCPVAVAPRGYATRYAARLMQIETWLDGTPGSEQAATLAARIAAGDHGDVRVRTAPEPGDRAGADSDMLIFGGRTNPHARRPHACALMVV